MEVILLFLFNSTLSDCDHYSHGAGCALFCACFIVNPVLLRKNG